MKPPRLFELIGWLILASTFADLSIAEICQFGTGNSVVNPYPALAKPQYLTPVSEPSYGGQVMRIANDYDASCGTGCVWQTDTRHHYSKDQPWSADGAVLALLNNKGTPPRIYLDGATYAVLGYTDHTNPPIHYTDWRWHPVYPYVQIVMDTVTSAVYWVDVRYPGDPPIKTCYFGDILQIRAGDAIGQFEGNPTIDGNLLAVAKASSDTVLILNMSSGTRGAPVRLPAPNLMNHAGTIGWGLDLARWPLFGREVRECAELRSER